MTNDVRRFDEFALMSNYLLIVPIQTMFILIISWYYIGPSCMATFSAFLVLAYLLSVLGKHLANLRLATTFLPYTMLFFTMCIYSHIGLNQ